MKKTFAAALLALGLAGIAAPAHAADAPGLLFDDVISIPGNLLQVNVLPIFPAGG
ncbi:hypothetical protein [Herbidospora cretacea]|uniref:hypothetical protein n=1 Tax=Herbidospora cretacea TaxID=28444 RepID=UPI000A6C8457|nr:hypothetical protein [Herbidospora cretacea]